MNMKHFAYIAFALFILVMSWEDQKSAASLFTNGPIPDQSIRLRIIANSDTPDDQVLKRQIRDNVNAYLETKVGSLKTIDEAREEIRSELPVLKKIVDKTIQEKGYTYKSKVELGVVPFPTKMYGQYVYPAGNYEALRVTIGKGLGQNWWCVLFPPLCFVDIATGDAVKPENGDSDKVQEQKAGKADAKVAKVEGKNGTHADQKTSVNNDKDGETEASSELPKIQFKFFIVVLIQNLIHAIFG